MPSPSPPAHAALDAARAGYWEDPEGSLAVAIEVRAGARGDGALQARPLALKGMISLHRGDLRRAFALAADAEREAGEDARAGAELAALKAHLDFFSGSYASSLQQAELAGLPADRTGDAALRVFARRMGCVAFGDLGVADWPERLDVTLALAAESGERWEEVLSLKRPRAPAHGAGRPRRGGGRDRARDRDRHVARRSTTASATRSATACWSGSPRCWSRSCGPRT